MLLHRLKYYLDDKYLEFKSNNDKEFFIKFCLGIIKMKMKKKISKTCKNNFYNIQKILLIQNLTKK